MIKNTHTTSFRIDKKTNVEAGRVASEKDMSKSALFRQAVKLHLAQIKAESQAVKNV